MSEHASFHRAQVFAWILALDLISVIEAIQKLVVKLQHRMANERRSAMLLATAAPLFRAGIFNIELDQLQAADFGFGVVELCRSRNARAHSTISEPAPYVSMFCRMTSAARRWPSDSAA